MMTHCKDVLIKGVTWLPDRVAHSLSEMSGVDGAKPAGREVCGWP